MDLTGIDLVVAGDVANPLTGPHGAAAVYGPQKGATPDDVATLDAGLGTWSSARPVRGPTPPPPAGRGPAPPAASGSPACCSAAGSCPAPTTSWTCSDFDPRVADCDVVVTGEGRIDDQTLHGKLPGVVAHRSRPRPVFAVVGRSDLSAAAADEMGLAAVHALTDHTDQNPAGDPQLSRSLLTELARTIPLAPERSVSSV